MYNYLFKTLLSILNRYPEVGLLGHVVILVLTFWGTFILFSITLEAFYDPPSNAQVSNFSTSSSAIVIFCFFFFFRVVCKLVSYCKFDCLSLMISDVELLLVCMFATCTSYLEKCLSKVLCLFFNGLLDFLLLFSCWHFLKYILDIRDFSGGLDGKASVYSAGDLGSIPGSGRSSGEGNGNPLQYSCLENPMDGEAR